MVPSSVTNMKYAVLLTVLLLALLSVGAQAGEGKVARLLSERWEEVGGWRS